ncbi:MAG: NAD(P)/FAD-dependent oxidoreductase [Nitrospirae bacterium]|nr:NAD(P)/FAD-dependent oxidoreductase [Nitrospirota bacterium]
MSKTRQLVVIGNGMSGIATVESLLKKTKDLDVTVFGTEQYFNYNRILLSSVLAGESMPDDIILNPQEWYVKNNIKLHTGTTIIRIDRDNKTVVTDSGEYFPYDTLLIATGSHPFLPPVKGLRTSKGVLLPGIFTFRNLDDTQAMMEWGRQSRKAIVIGGGLLGLEAATGLVNNGLDVTVVHLMDRLMEMQLDSESAGILKKEITRLGINVLLNHSADEIITDGNEIKGVRFSNGSAHESDMVVIAAGIRPNTKLAAESGISVNRGIVVDDYMQTSAPGIYAVGECVEHRGNIYGIVAPIFEQAKVAAGSIIGDRKDIYKGSVMATKLKVADIPLAAIGNIKQSAGCEEVVFSDAGASVYRKLVIQGGIVSGAILMGDMEGYDRYLKLIQDQEDISLQRRTILFDHPEKFKSVASMPDNTTICGCMGVSKGEIIQAIEEHGLTSIQGISEKTRACTSCKGCAPLIEQILQNVLGGEYVRNEGSKIFCDCIPLTWEDIKKKVAELNIKSVGRILQIMGNGHGCASCRHGLHYMLTVLYLDDFEKEPDTIPLNDMVHANVQKNETFSVVPRIYGGVITTDELRLIADVADRYEVPMVKITGGQRIDLLGIKREQLQSVWSDLNMPSGHAYTKAVRTCKTCVGELFCRYGVKNSVELGIKMEKFFQGIPCPGKVKMGVSGCPRNCVEVRVKDIGVVGIQTGWEIYVGGNGGVKTRIADLLTVVGTEEEVINVSEVFMQYYRENARWTERTGDFVERVGIVHLREVLLEDKACLVDNLRSRMRQVIASYKDPWTEAREETALS